MSGYNGTQSAALNFAGNVDAPMAVFRAQIGRPRPQVREYSAKFSTRYNLSGIFTDTTAVMPSSTSSPVKPASLSFTEKKFPFLA